MVNSFHVMLYATINSSFNILPFDLNKISIFCRCSLFLTLKLITKIFFFSRSTLSVRWAQAFFFFLVGIFIFNWQKYYTCMVKQTRVTQYISFSSGVHIYSSDTHQNIVVCIFTETFCQWLSCCLVTFSGREGRPYFVTYVYMSIITCLHFCNPKRSEIPKEFLLQFNGGKT